MSDEVVSGSAGADDAQVQEGAVEQTETQPVATVEQPITRKDLQQFMEDMKSSNEQMLRSFQSQRDMTVSQVRKAVDEHMARVETVLNRPEFPPHLRDKMREEEKAKAEEEAWRSVVQSGDVSGQSKAGQPSNPGAPQGQIDPYVKAINDTAFGIIRDAGLDPDKFDWDKTDRGNKDASAFLRSVYKAVAEMAPEEGGVAPEARIVGAGGGGTPVPDKVAKLTSELNGLIAKDPMNPKIAEIQKELASLLKK